ncbi:MAG: hypothetical protein DRH97_00360 [Chloroflexi bacterium]|nr:MAG: hypothetical protein DRH97_00360 [Chloroflexota bacterium]
MKALSIKQPWADWILGKNLPDGIEPKDIENRSWLPPKTFDDSYFYIHASKQISKDAFQWFRDEFKCEPITEGYITGAIIGRVMLCDVLWHDEHNGGKWGMDGFYHWILADVIVIEPIPAKGRLLFWDCSEYFEEESTNCGCHLCNDVTQHDQDMDYVCDECKAEAL